MHALVIYRTLPMHVRVLTQKSEEATASSASLLAMPLLCYSCFFYTIAHSLVQYLLMSRE